MPLLAQLVVEYVADLTDLETGSQRAIAIVNGFEGSASAPLALSSSLTQAGQSATSLSESAAMAGSAAVTMAGEVEQSSNALNNETSSAERAASELEQMSQAANNAGNQEESLASKSEQSSMSLLDMGSKLGMAVMGFQSLAQMATQTATSLLEPAASAEQLQGSLEIFTGSAAAAKKEMQDLSDFSSHTPFETTAIDRAALKLQSVGISAKDIIPDLTALGDGLDAVGRTSEADLNMVADTFMKIKTEGHLTTEAMNSFSAQGIDAWSVLEKQTGQTHAALQKMISAGLYPANQAMKDLTTGMEANPLYKGQMANDANVLVGAVSTLKSDWDQLLVSFGSPIIKMLEVSIGGINTALTSPAFKDFAAMIGTNIANALTTVISIISKFGAEAGKVLNILNDESLYILIDSIQNLGSSIGNALAPALKVVGDLFSQMFSDGSIESGALSLEGSFYDIADAIQKVSNLIQGLTNFFESNSIQAQIVKDLMIGIGVAIAAIQLGALIEALPIIIAGIGVWGAEMLVVAIETVIAMAPIVLIGLAIAVVVAIIILAIQHWGEIAAWLQGAWSNTVSFFAGIWASIVGFFGGIGQWFQDKFKQAADGVKTGFQGAKDFFTGVGNWFKDQGTQTAADTKTGLTAVSDNYMAMAHSAADSMIWLYNHNYYVKAAVDGIVKWVQDAGAWLQNTWKLIVAWITTEWQALTVAATLYWGMVTSYITARVNEAHAFLVSVWTAITGWLSAQWTMIAAAATLVWGAVTTYITDRTNEAHAFLVSIWTAITGWIGAQWNLLANMANAAWAAVSAVFASIWTTHISGPLGSLYNQIVGWFTNLGNQAHTSGTNFINMLVSGIQSGAGAVWNAVVGIANTIWTALGFHSPAKAGPGADADVWMPNLMNMLVGGINAGVPDIQTAVNNAAGALAGLNTSASVNVGTGNSISPVSTASTQIQALTKSANSSGSSGDSGLAQLNIYWDTTQVTNMVMDKAQKQIDLRVRSK